MLHYLSFLDFDVCDESRWQYNALHFHRSLILTMQDEMHPRMRSVKVVIVVLNVNCDWKWVLQASVIHPDQWVTEMSRVKSETPISLVMKKLSEVPYTARLVFYSTTHEHVFEFVISSTYSVKVFLAANLAVVTGLYGPVYFCAIYNRHSHVVEIAQGDGWKRHVIFVLYRRCCAERVAEKVCRALV